MLAKLKVALGQAPWDQHLRLVYADCLDDHDQPEAAEDQRLLAAKKQRRCPKGRLARDAHDSTDSNAIYRKLHKRRFARCDLCGWHNGENAGRRPARASWKRNKKKYQWRPK